MSRQRDNKGRFARGNSIAKGSKGKASLMGKFMKKKRKKILNKIYKEAMNGNDKALTWLAGKAYGHAPHNDLKFPNKSSAKLVKLLLKNADSLPAETLASLSKLVELQVKVKDKSDLLSAIEKLDKKVSGKKSNGWK